MKYRIKKYGPDGWKEYYIQYRYKWWPFWLTTVDMWGCNKIYSSFTKAKEALESGITHKEEVTYNGET